MMVFTIIGCVHLSTNETVFYGIVESINDLATFEGETVKELTEGFRYAVDEHIKDCEAENICLFQALTNYLEGKNCFKAMMFSRKYLL